MRVRVLSVVLALAASSSILLHPTLSAQSFTPKRELKNLSPAALTTLHTLETLTELPAGDWRLHVGDVPHGESAALDDSSWKLVTPHSKAPKDAVWYRRTIEVPKTLNGYDLTGSRIWFQFRAEAYGPMPVFFYFNGRRVAIGDDLEPIVLFAPAKPGDKILVAVKLLHTVDDKTFEGANLRIDPNPDDPASEAPAPTPRTSASSASPRPTSLARLAQAAHRPPPHRRSRHRRHRPQRGSPPPTSLPSTPPCAKPSSSSRRSTPSSSRPPRTSTETPTSTPLPGSGPAPKPSTPSARTFTHRAAADE